LTLFPRPPYNWYRLHPRNLGGHHAWGSAWRAGHRRRGARSPRRADRSGCEVFV